MILSKNKIMLCQNKKLIISSMPHRKYNETNNIISMYYLHTHNGLMDILKPSTFKTKFKSGFFL